MQMMAPPLSRFNKVLIISSVAIFLLNSIVAKVASFSLVGLLGLSQVGVHQGFIFQFLTYPIAESSFTSVLFNNLLVWFIGSELEMRWGQKFYIKFMLVSALLPGFFYYLFSLYMGGAVSVLPLMGLAGVTYALLMAYAIIFSERQLTFMLLFPMKARYFCMLLIGIQLYMAIFSAYAQVAWTHLFAMLSGFLFLKWHSMLAQGKSFSAWRARSAKKSMRKKLYIVPDEDKDKANPKDPKFWQ